MITELLAINADEMALVHAHCFEKAWDAEYFTKVLEQGSLALGMFEGETLIGFIHVQIAADQADILTFCVLPDFQTKGVGSALFAELKERLRAKKIKTLFLEVHDKNLSALKIYRKFGAIPLGQRANYYLFSNNVPGNAILLSLEIEKN